MLRGAGSPRGAGVLACVLLAVILSTETNWILFTKSVVSVTKDLTSYDQILRYKKISFDKSKLIFFALRMTTNDNN